MDNIRIREAGLRDGLQGLGDFLATDKKKAWFEACYAAGVREFDLTSFVPPKLLPQFSDAAEMVEFSNSFQDMKASILVPNLKGVERAVQSGARRIMYVLSASEAHNMSNLRRTTEDSLQELERVVDFLQSLSGPERPKLLVGISTAFGCTLQGEVAEPHVLAMVERILRLGVDEICLADTVGYADPASVRRLFSDVKSLVSCDLSAHFHDTRGLGLANVVAALDVGITLFDASLGGLGGCPFAPGASGNIATEDLVFMLTQMGLDTGIDMERLLEARQLLENLLPTQMFHDHISQTGLPKNFNRLKSNRE